MRPHRLGADSTGGILSKRSPVDSRVGAANHGEEGALLCGRTLGGHR